MPSFGEMPEVLRYLDGEGFGAQSFYYDHSGRQFLVGGTSFQVTGPETMQELLFPGGVQLTLDEVPKHPVVINNTAHPIATPRMFTWLTSTDIETAFEDTKTVMREVFADIQNIEIDATNQEGLSVWNFGAHFIREGHVRLQVIGDCACLGTIPDGGIVDSDDWETGYVEYGLHNIDMPAQYISLFAGLGHLASLALQQQDS